jgi:hypothetical protein
LSEFRDKARRKGIKFRIIACGPRSVTYKNFQKALKSQPHAFNLLLVDSEGPVSGPPWAHLNKQDGWKKPPGVTDEQCHLMVQDMEAWFLADVTALKRFYGAGFNENALSSSPNVENIPKERLQEALKQATQNTTKRKYDKMLHGPDILAQLDPAKIRAAAPHCGRFFGTLAGQME